MIGFRKFIIGQKVRELSLIKNLVYVQNLATFGDRFLIFLKFRNLYIQYMYTPTNCHVNPTKNESLLIFKKLRHFFEGGP